MERLRLVPAVFERGALRRLERGFAEFFRRVRAKKKPGFPRFRSWRRYNSLEHIFPAVYVVKRGVRVPVLGKIVARGRLQVIGQQKALRIIHRASGWYAQVVVDQGTVAAETKPQSAVGIDVGLNAFATLSNGEKIENPRFYRKAQSKLRHAQRRLSRCKKGSKNRRKAVNRVARQHELTASQRRDFSHRAARRLVNRFDFIAFEELNIKGLARTWLAKSVHDAGWGQFLFFVTYKAANAGKITVKVNPSGTSQECPGCGAVAKKSLSERRHRCECGIVELDRDHAAAMVILARAARSTGRESLVEGSANTTGHTPLQVGPLKQEVVRTVPVTIEELEKPNHEPPTTQPPLF